MLRVKDRAKVPHGGYRYRCPHCTAEFIAHTLGRVVTDTKKHFIANNVPVPSDLVAQIEDQFCQSNAYYCEDSPGTSPTLVQQASNFAKSMWRWAQAGFPTVDEATFNARANICQACPKFQGWKDLGVGRCKLCGCCSGRNVGLKLLMKTEACPDKPSRW